MYEELDFAPEKECVNVLNMENALQSIEPFDTTSQKVSFADIQVSLDGIANLIVDTNIRKMTQWSLQSLCRFLQIPDPFARKIPIDLLQKNITRLLREKKDEGIILLIGKENEIVNIVKSKYRPFPNKEFLTEIDKLFKNMTTIEWESMRIGPRGFDLNVINSAIKPLEPKVGDITKIGFRILNSDTGDRDAMARLYLYRLTCQNGATMTSDWGCVRRDSNKNISLNKDFQYFMQNVQNLKVNVERLSTVYSKIPETSLTDFQVESVWKAVNRIAGKEQADSVIGKDEEGRKTILHLVDFKRSYNRQLFAEGQKEPEATDVNVYDAYNRVTDCSKKYEWRSSLQLQAIGGRILSMLTKHFLNEN